MATSLSEQTKDLSSCSVCYDTFNEKKLKPKYLSCLHTFCLKCTKVNMNCDSLIVEGCFLIMISKIFVSLSENGRPPATRQSHLSTLWQGLQCAIGRIWQFAKQPARPSHGWTEEGAHWMWKHCHCTWQCHHYTRKHNNFPQQHQHKAQQYPREWTVSFCGNF